MQTYRLVVELGAVENYAKTLGVLTEEECDVAMDKANRENDTDFAPGPGVVYDIAMEMREGQAHPAFKEMATWTPAGERPEWLLEPGWIALKNKLRNPAR